MFSASGDRSFYSNFFGVNLAFAGLIARVGTQTPFYIGEYKTFTCPIGGQLTLRMNDDDLNDNSGSIEVQIQVR